MLHNSVKFNVNKVWKVAYRIGQTLGGVKQSRKTLLFVTIRGQDYCNKIQGYTVEERDCFNSVEP